MPYIWVKKTVVLALHDEQILEHGGQPGLRDEGLLDSALMRPINRDNYEGGEISTVAAAYGYGITRNHPFFDGNKRISLVVTELFLTLNGFTLEADDGACLDMFLRLAQGSLSERSFSVWIEGNIAQANF
ncbi:type II toxin-antitoxin system death-on-curing family toxin [Terasakiella sp. A23]|uniref:type II toxin-antitoxin system death-on-curing family toxin n=1 Tax=Terasakiella sp. FCG-A23 TaxID=3080561 RepID=UPI002952FC5D|nr:type II toxin-antitoxin system death-on-curing family toxin [Terasakiella sp. A23]MDV7341815.1 type II toxin-antitoxin system death-on-curing family toxin [Terasakiella sp. A23]